MYKLLIVLLFFSSNLNSQFDYDNWNNMEDSFDSNEEVGHFVRGYLDIGYNNYAPECITSPNITWIVNGLPTPCNPYAIGENLPNGFGFNIQYGGYKSMMGGIFNVYGYLDLGIKKIGETGFMHSGLGLGLGITKHIELGYIFASRYWSTNTFESLNTSTGVSSYERIISGGNKLFFSFNIKIKRGIPENTNIPSFNLIGAFENFEDNDRSFIGLGLSYNLGSKQKRSKLW